MINSSVGNVKSPIVKNVCKCNAFICILEIWKEKPIYFCM